MSNFIIITGFLVVLCLQDVLGTNCNLPALKRCYQTRPPFDDDGLQRYCKYFQKVLNCLFHIVKRRCGIEAARMSLEHDYRSSEKGLKFHQCSINVGLQLVGDDGSRGRLEVFRGGTWKTVCAGVFSDSSAAVVCNMLGFGYVGTKTNNEYGVGSEQVWLDNVKCSGREQDIDNCPHSGWRDDSCGGHDVLAVSCTTVRLVGGASLRDGRLEMLYRGVWGSLCHRYTYDSRDAVTRVTRLVSEGTARVVCSMLGFGHSGYLASPEVYVSGGTILQRKIFCKGQETDVRQCSSGSVSKSTPCASDNKLIRVSCEAGIRLVGGPNSREGRLELASNDIWGTVCSDGFTDAAARVACNSLGFGYVGRQVPNTYGDIGSSPVPIWLDDVQCNGTERHIADCSHAGWGVSNCDHREDVAISCDDPPTTTPTTTTATTTPAAAPTTPTTATTTTTTTPAAAPTTPTTPTTTTTTTPAAAPTTPTTATTTTTTTTTAAPTTPTTPTTTTTTTPAAAPTTPTTATTTTTPAAAPTTPTTTTTTTATP